MGKHSNTFAEAYRNNYAKFLAIGLVILFAWMFFHDYTKPELVSRLDAEGRVVAVHVSGSEESAPSSIIIEIEVEGKVFRSILNSKPLPNVGEKVPVSVEIYSDKTKWYSLNKQKWKESKIGY